ncbi:MAG: transporter [Opitutus sp.]|nr:transporter [Opitutus sp.]
MIAAGTGARPPLRFSRPEWSGAFGDVGTDLPLLIAMLAVSGLAAGPVFVAFGVALIFSGWIYRLPMPVQPLKAMAVVVIAGQVTGAQLQLGGLMLGLTILALALGGALDWLARVIPLAVVRGVQAGLALNLGWAALKMIGRDGWAGWPVALIAMVVLLVLRRSTRWPVGLLVVIAGAAWALWSPHTAETALVAGPAPLFFGWPELPWQDWTVVLVLLVLPQLPLSLANSLVATERTVRDLFPARVVHMRALGVTFAALNFIAPLLGGVPVCHGCGGLAGHHALGARSGGSVVIYGAVFVLGGLLFGTAFAEVARRFPFPLLGALLVLEAGVLFSLARDQLGATAQVLTVALVALACAFLPFGYLIGVVAGTLVHHALRFLLIPRTA